MLNWKGTLLDDPPNRIRDSQLEIRKQILCRPRDVLWDEEARFFPTRKNNHPGLYFQGMAISRIRLVVLAL